MLEDRLTQAAAELERGWESLSPYWNDKKSSEIHEKYIGPLLEQSQVLSRCAEDLRLLMNRTMQQMMEV